VVNLSNWVLDGCSSGLFGDYSEGLWLFSLVSVELYFLGVYSFFSLIDYRWCLTILIRGEIRRRCWGGSVLCSVLTLQQQLLRPTAITPHHG
jgi:hypothetical protein